MLIRLDKFSNLNSYKTSLKQKDLFLKEILKLNNFHKKNSEIYRNIVKIKHKNRIKKIEDLPFLPTRIFKNLNLKTIKDKSVFKILESSGTGGNISKIFLDKKNANTQIKILSKIFKDFFSINTRMPMIIFDKKKTKNKNFKHSAREAAYTGFSFMGKEHIFLLDEKEDLKIHELKKFLKKFKKTKIFLFGLTSVIWKLLNKPNNIKFDLTNSILIHGGGWKKINDQNATKKNFENLIKRKFNLSNIHDYYGMVEQTGSIFFECEKCGSFYSTKYSKIFIRNKKLDIIKKGRGMIQLISSLPTSYPGHNILTEDEGEIVNNNCDCKKYGNRFKVHGRIEKSEIRGCSNV